MHRTVAVIAQVILLLGMLIGFHFILLSQLIDERADQLRSTQRVLGQDPGIRVLLRNRADNSTGYQRVRIQILQASVLHSPQLPGNPEYRLILNPQDQLHCEPHPTEGLRLSTSEGEWHWPVDIARLQPLKQTPIPEGDNQDASDPRLYEAADRKPTIAVNKYRYRGSLDLHRAGPAEVQAINILPIESYLGGVIAAEMNPSYPIEALKAQAVAARSYAFAKAVMNTGGRIYDVSDTVDDQEYHGENPAGSKVDWAVDETRGLILTVGGVPFTPFSAPAAAATLPLLVTYSPVLAQLMA